jgi:hypothetical protein
MNETTVEYDGQNFHFQIIDIDGIVHTMTLHPVGVIQLVRELKREREVMVHWNDHKPKLKVIRDEDC